MTQVSWLDRIHSPEDLRALPFDALTELASEIRQVVAETCSRNGGHFAPSLGVVELTIALHCVMDTPRDKLIWDVGHQCYPHKMLTGRARRFHTLRQPGGISGFPRRDESPYDAFGVGHASTAISAALGMALARDANGEDYRVIAVCGDGAMSGGLCYEALNNVGYLSPNILIVLNDNEMSIAPPIGAMSRYFNQLITTQFYNRSKQTAKDLLQRMPAVGQRVLNIGHKIESSIKNLIVPQETIFEKMGIRYLGPIDGHDLGEVVTTLRHVRDLKGPMLLHVKTVKGKGYEYSESDPERWHSGCDFEVETGRKMVAVGEGVSGQPPTYTEVFAQTLVQEAEKDRRITAITAAMPAGTGLSLFADKFPKRFYDVGIAESHAVCCAAGMACEGLRPVVAIYSSFLQRAFDQIVHDVALQNLPVTFAIDRAGIVGDDGPTHHGVFDLSYLRMVPGLVVMAARDEAELRRMVVTAARYDGGPIAYRYPRSRGTGATLDETPEPIEIGRGEVLYESARRSGRPSVAILSIGTMSASALSAAAILESKGIACAVADMRFVKPLDRTLLKRLAEECDLVVTVEENVVAGGFGSAVNEAVGAMEIERRVVNLGLPDRWIEHGRVPDLLKSFGLDARGIARHALSALESHAQSVAHSEVVAK
ncbi:1-deoxy-D-xylulose-5-phosphate synthase [Candidatus Sumerlaeota bacterium]|nr:1-deoxy-D-xylulose-5-phosphate synthase [Candidatus Sumerlaeota bacterium]